MKIDILCNDGSPLGISAKTVYGDKWRTGVGGAELALITLCEAFTKDGHVVTLYNNPLEPNASIFRQMAVNAFDPNESRDVLIVFRSPNKRAIGAKGLKVWWSCDQYTVGNYSDYAGFVDKIICISEFHADYFRRVYGIENATVIGIPVREYDYPVEVDFSKKVDGRLIYCSVPERGLHLLPELFSGIVSGYSKASLVITSDYRLWGVDVPLNYEYRVMLLRNRDAGNIKFYGALPRNEFVIEQQRAQIMVYPCIYDELFCISCAEAQWNGILPVTSSYGALRDVNMGIVIDGDPNTKEFADKFIDTVTSLLHNQDRLLELQKEVYRKARKKFSISKALEQWYEVFR